MVESLILHPALLVAKGFESLNTRDMRFLHVYRRYFEEAKEKHKTRVYSPEDFQLGGILNPESQFLDVHATFMEASDRIDSFPYLTLYEVRTHFYYGRISQIFDALMSEVFRGLDDSGVLDYYGDILLRVDKRIIKSLERTRVYNQIMALHRCGLERKLSGAFQYVLSRYVAHIKESA